MTLSEIVEQLRWCEYECIGGMLVDNVAFRDLEEMAGASRARPQIVFIPAEVMGALDRLLHTATLYSGNDVWVAHDIVRSWLDDLQPSAEPQP